MTRSATIGPRRHLTQSPGPLPDRHGWSPSTPPAAPRWWPAAGPDDARTPHPRPQEHAQQICPRAHVPVQPPELTGRRRSRPKDPPCRRQSALAAATSRPKSAVRPEVAIGTRHRQEAHGADPARRRLHTTAHQSRDVVVVVHPHERPSRPAQSPAAARSTSTLPALWSISHAHPTARYDPVSGTCPRRSSAPPLISSAPPPDRPH